MTDRKKNAQNINGKKGNNMTKKNTAKPALKSEVTQHNKILFHVCDIEGSEFEHNVMLSHMRFGEFETHGFVTTFEGMKNLRDMLTRFIESHK